MRLIKKNLFGILLLQLTLVSCQPKETSKQPVLDPPSRKDTIVGTSVNFEGIKIGASIAYKNLQLFPITGKASLDHVSYMTLGVAMEKDKVIVHETGSVNNLTITNKSDKYIYIQSGDIVKGGRQDRTIQYDVLIPPGEKEMNLNSFCVEQSRWSKRGKEETNQFSTSKKMLSNRETKLAAKSQGNQSYVWSSVTKTQNKINGTLKDEIAEGVDVTMNASASSLQLTLENEELTELIEDYKKALEINLPKDSLIGFAYAVNGEFYGIELYNNSYLFTSMKNKLIESVITEAISDKKKGEDIRNLTLENLLTVLDSAKYKTEEKAMNKSCKWVSSVDDINKIYKYSLVDLSHGNMWLHKNWVNGSGVEENTTPDANQQYRSSNSLEFNQRIEPIEIVK